MWKKALKTSTLLLTTVHIASACVDERTGQQLDRDRSIHRHIPSNKEVSAMGASQEQANQAFEDILKAERQLANIGLRIKATLVVDKQDQIQNIRFHWDEVYLRDFTTHNPPTTLSESILLLEEYSLAINAYISNYSDIIPFVEDKESEDFFLDVHFEESLKKQRDLVDDFLKLLVEMQKTEQVGS